MLKFEFPRLKTQLLCHMVWGKLLYSNLQISKACTIHIHSELCMGVRRLLRNYAKACLEPRDIATLSLVRGVQI